MDAHSKKGLEKLKLTDHALEIWHENYPEWNYTTLPFSYPAAVDYIIFGPGNPALMEFRVRESGITRKEMIEKGKKMILSTDKFNKCILLSDLLGIPTYFWAYLPNDGIIISWKLYEPQTGVYVPFDHIKLATRKSVNDATKRNKPCIGLSIDDGSIIVEGITDPR